MQFVATGGRFVATASRRVRPLPRVHSIDTAIPPSERTLEPAMSTQFTARATAFGLALMMTLCLIGSIDFLASDEPTAAAMMAAANAPRG